MCQSLGKLYLHFGMHAFRQNRLLQALSLFDTSSDFWKSADATGKAGVCLLYLGAPEEGKYEIAKAKSMRHGDE